GSAQTAFEDVTHPEFPPNLLYVNSAALVGEAAVTRDDEQRRISRQRRDDILSDAVAEELLLRISAHICERKHRDRWLIRQCERRLDNAVHCSTCRLTSAHSIRVHGSGDVL